VKLRFTHSAARDLDRIRVYVAQQTPHGARRVRERIQAVIALILEHPRAGHPTSRPGMRRIVVSPYPYLIFYRVSKDEIVIHAVRHSARDPRSMPAGRRP
jgi:toxin ParE1/3/4